MSVRLSDFLSLFLSPSLIISYFLSLSLPLPSFSLLLSSIIVIVYLFFILYICFLNMSVSMKK